MSASPEFYRPWSAAPQLYSPRVLPGATAAADEDEYYSCRTPTGAGISSSYLGTGTGTAACPPAPRKPRPQPAACRKRLFDVAAVISVRYDELDRIFRPAPPAPSKQGKLADPPVSGSSSRRAAKA
ncbi:cyclin-dependent protein kinase inhibitor EL2 [Brachypodium distachyon]|uniref:Uncharacterized protein n=1 Tax=Brachypodium distachyon TaxID=15368 RepID=I1HAQ9_BRADI|nr:cyclin-dependent protein kinase inhibitor EL2 [Brachypodium distachyon]KQK24082.1 hypothetical protein BRADI_1g78050v3 [Brachypodium distachyon]|eukprot:XP_003559011.1 cyclin-dependent protein kinase inhibitor EL2 [Brachypodium distachyon]